MKEHYPEKFRVLVKDKSEWYDKLAEHLNSWSHGGYELVSVQQIGDWKKSPDSLWNYALEFLIVWRR